MRAPPWGTIGSAGTPQVLSFQRPDTRWANRMESPRFGRASHGLGLLGRGRTGGLRRRFVTGCGDAPMRRETDLFTSASSFFPGLGFRGSTDPNPLRAVDLSFRCNHRSALPCTHRSGRAFPVGVPSKGDAAQPASAHSPRYFAMLKKLNNSVVAISGSPLANGDSRPRTYFCMLEKLFKYPSPLRSWS